MSERIQPATLAIHRGMRRLWGVALAASLASTELLAETPVAFSTATPGLNNTPATTNQIAATSSVPSPSIWPLAEISNATVTPGLTDLAGGPDNGGSAGLPAPLLELQSETNQPLHESASKEKTSSHLQKRLETARSLRLNRRAAEAEPLLTDLLKDESPEEIRQSALLELAGVAQDQNDLPRTQQIYAQFLSKWPTDLRIPDILFRQGLVFRRMGLNNLALTKFYGVMTSALVLKNDQLDYYVRLVSEAQIEIAETHYALGKYSDAAEFFSRLLKQTNSISKPQILYKLSRCQFALGKYAETIASAQDFLLHYPQAPEQPEIRFELAVALKNVGRDNEALQQVLLLLQEQRERRDDRPAVWGYWQQRAGNLIANYLYREGDYTKALQIYLNLAELDSSLAWRLPVNYQIGMTYERLWQPQRALGIYTEILSHEKTLGTQMPPALKTVLDMARWRISFIEWQNKAEAANRQFRNTAETDPSARASLPAKPVSIP